MTDVAIVLQLAAAIAAVVLPVIVGVRLLAGDDPDLLAAPNR